MAGRVLLGKSVNSNLGHSSGKYGLYISRTGDDVTNCTKDQLIFNTDNIGSLSGAIDLGQFQVISQTDQSNNEVASRQLSVNANATASISFTNLTSTGHLLYAIFEGAASGEDNITKLFRTNYSGASTVDWENLGDTAITAEVSIFKGFSTASLF